jgi:hypothetical protein
MKRMYLWGVVGVLLIGAFFVSKAIREGDWSGLGAGGLCAGFLTSRRVAAEEGLNEKRPVPPIDAVIPATQQTATFALG